LREFNYLKLMELSLPVNIYHTIAKIHEYKGKQELYVKNYPDVLDKMIDVAKIQSTKSSNAIEGIYTNDARLNELMNKKAEPGNRNEEEIAGYRHVLDIIHENYAYIEFNKNDILTLHNQLYSYSYVNYKGKFKTLDNTIMEVEDYTSIHEKSFRGISFSIRKGEILGFGGLVGAQRTELMEGIFGIRHITKGKVKVHGKEVSIKRPKDAMEAGIGMITEDRRGNGIFGCLSIKDNVGVSIYNKYLRAGVMLDHPSINKIVDENIKRLSIKTPSMKEQIGNLSGGNQQKVIISRWLAKDPDILIMDEPTRGIDIGAKHEIYEIMEELAKQGKAIIMISSEMPELLGMADRICVMCNGKLTGELNNKEEMTQENVMNFATMF